jgi:hypothetical protein
MILPFHFDFALRRPRHGHLRRVQHIFNENAVTGCRIVYKNVGDRTDELAVLNNRATAHECVQVGTTHFYNFLTVSTLFIKKIVLYSSILAYILTQTNTEKLFF